MRESHLELSVGCCPYDRIQPLVDGRVMVPGVDLRFDLSKDTVKRQGSVASGRYDVAEAYICGYFAQKARGLTEYIGLPIFLKRMFRHSYIYVNRTAGIRTPSDLANRRIGIQSWATTTAVWMKGILAEDFGVDLSSIEWFSLGRDSYLDLELSSRFSVEILPQEADLEELLAEGHLDAAITTATLAPGGDPRIDFLFPNYVDLEREYYERTRFFPIMHVLLVRESLVEDSANLGAHLTAAFMEAKKLTYEWLEWQRIHQTGMWYRELWEREMLVSEGDPYPWGFDNSKLELEKLIEYCVDQDLLPARLPPQSFFHPSGFGL